MICRAADQTDTPWLTATSLAAYRTVFVPLLPKCDWSSYDGAYFSARFAREWPDVRIAVEGQLRHGFSLVTRANLDMLFVAEGKRRSGTGLILLNEAERQGARALECFAANGPARRFYERHGWLMVEAYAREFAGRYCDFVRYRKA